MTIAVSLLPFELVKLGSKGCMIIMQWELADNYYLDTLPCLYD